MLANFHTHTVFCDGKNTVDEVVKAAIEKGFSAVGFSAHGYTDFDKSYCMKDELSYIQAVKRAKEKYKNKIDVYLGVEEDIYAFVDRSKYEYLIGSAHYYKIGENYAPIDSSKESFQKCVSLFNGDAERLAEEYYRPFCEYIVSRKPDIVGHFDLITKYEEVENSLFLNNENYFKIAEKYLKAALKSECIFEVNTGAIARGYRTSPYPHERLLRILQQNDGKVMLSSDCHSAEKLDFYFKETETLLKEIGFQSVYTLKDGRFQKIEL